MTNEERIKNMNIEELSIFIRGACVCRKCPAWEFCKISKYSTCKAVILKWLESEFE